MVNLMVIPCAAYADADTREHGATVLERADGTAMGLKDPSACVFWCAVALGAVMKGSPVESVSRTVLYRCQEAQRQPV